MIWNSCILNITLYSVQIRTYYMNTNANRNRLLNMLADAGIRPSVQRLAILEYVSSCTCHPTADEIYDVLHRQNPLLSRTTVFSCVKLLSEKGLLNDIDISSGSTRYDSTQFAPHAHFMCRNCRRIFDIPLDTSVLVVPENFLCDNINVFYKGICPECSNK